MKIILFQATAHIHTVTHSCERIVRVFHCQLEHVQTTHLGVDVPEGECWIKVGEHTRNWMNGKVIICDTSFMHETSNDSEMDRYVLILRHWHPEVTEVEKAANQFLFEALDDGTSAGVALAKKQAQKRLNALVSVRGKKKKRGGKAGAGGFGKK